MQLDNRKFQLKIFNLPVIETIDDLAECTRLSPPLIKYLTYRADHLYKVFHIPKKIGEFREIAHPCRELKAIQGWILRHILDKLSPSENSKGFELGSSTLENASPHIGSNFLLNIDLKDFFPTIVASKVYGVFHSIGYNKKIAGALTSLCVFKGRLPQGAPTSPKLANLVCLKLDARIQGYAGPRGIVFTRYADDISLSAQTLKKIQNAKNLIHTIVASEGLEINNRKTSISGTRKRKKITGLVITENSVGIGRDLTRQIRAKIHHLFIEKSTNFSHVNGLLAYTYSVDKKSYRKLDSFIEKLKLKYPLCPATTELYKIKNSTITQFTKVCYRTSRIKKL
ncbi:Hypothetical protein HEAR0006 [Herminiimonas arsenicoxydans]|uniref:RNA-directed DNA polymerase n=1 Tax=Herminiimonas arsenicoxydans TaxID=204773 RepID=A4G158_HERAR|nr:Hypothetical protein HEAR0006 [Herminiimonas arsenicoxydans]